VCCFPLIVHFFFFFFFLFFIASAGVTLGGNDFPQLPRAAARIRAAALPRSLSSRAQPAAALPCLARQCQALPPRCRCCLALQCRFAVLAFNATYQHKCCFEPMHRNTKPNTATRYTRRPPAWHLAAACHTSPSMPSAAEPSRARARAKGGSAIACQMPQCPHL